MAPPKRRKTNAIPNPLNSCKIGSPLRKVQKTPKRHRHDNPSSHTDYHIITRSRAKNQPQSLFSPGTNNVNSPIKSVMPTSPTVLETLKCNPLPRTPSKLAQEITTVLPLSSQFSKGNSTSYMPICKVFSTPPQNQRIKPCLSTSKIHMQNRSRKSVHFSETPTMRIHFTHSPIDYDRTAAVNTKQKKCSGVISKNNWRRIFQKLDEFKLAEMDSSEQSLENVKTYVVSENEKEDLLSMRMSKMSPVANYAVKDFMEMAESCSEKENKQEKGKEQEILNGGLLSMFGKVSSGLLRMIPTTQN